MAGATPPRFRITEIGDDGASSLRATSRAYPSGRPAVLGLFAAALQLSRTVLDNWSAASARSALPTRRQHRVIHLSNLPRHGDRTGGAPYEDETAARDDRPAWRSRQPPPFACLGGRFGHNRRCRMVRATGDASSQRLVCPGRRTTRGDPSVASRRSTDVRQCPRLSRRRAMRSCSPRRSGSTFVSTA